MGEAERVGLGLDAIQGDLMVSVAMFRTKHDLTDAEVVLLLAREAARLAERLPRRP